jgi:hypothetical protein
VHSHVIELSACVLQNDEDFEGDVGQREPGHRADLAWVPTHEIKTNKQTNNQSNKQTMTYSAEMNS